MYVVLLFKVFPYFTFHNCKVCTASTFSFQIFIICTFSLLSLLILIEVCEFYWSFQKHDLCFIYFSSIVLLVSISVISALTFIVSLLFPYKRLLWFRFVIFLNSLGGNLDYWLRFFSSFRMNAFCVINLSLSCVLLCPTNFDMFYFYLIQFNVFF